MLTINAARFLADFRALAQIGATGDGGVSRTALSPQDVRVRAWFRERIEEAGFEYHMDGAGNQSARWRCPDEDAPTLLLGSHLDSVRDGGRFDGALGVLCAFEVLRALRDAGERLPFHLEAISFTDEEGSLVGLLGSAALAGRLTPEHLRHPRGGSEALRAGLARVGLTEESILAARRDPDTLMGYLEVHIEQGTRLEESGTDIGVVTALAGLRSIWLRFVGEAAHAGATPMDRRRDALWGAADFIQRARARVMADFAPGVMNCGEVRVRPGAFNIVPGQVELALEFRHGTDETLGGMEAALLALAREAAEAFGLAVEATPVGQERPALMDETFMAAIEDGCRVLGLSSKRLMSLALHDAQYLSQVMPTAMIFVPSVDGVSHNPAEFTRDQDCINGANVLLQTVLNLRR